MLKPNRRMRIISSLLLFLFPVICMGQQARQYSFRHFSTSQGLESNMVYSIVQDPDGYMWFATANGLQRYDGSSFVNFRYKKNDPHSIPSDQLSSFYLDAKKRLWVIGNNNRFGTWDTRKFVFNEYFFFNHDSAGLKLFFETPSGKLMLLLEGSNFYRLDEEKKVFLPDHETIPLPDKWKCNNITWDHVAKRYWLSCDSGLVQVNPVNGNMNYRHHNPEGDPIIAACDTIMKPVGVTTDGKGHVIFMTWPYLSGQPHFYWADPLHHKVSEYLFANQFGYHEPKGFLLQRNGRLWVHGHPFFAEWTGGGPAMQAIPNEFRNEQSLKFDYAYQSFEDRENNIWIATDNGVYLFNPDHQVFNAYYMARPDGKPARELVVQAAEETKDNTLLIGCWGSGLFAFNSKLEPVPLPGGLKIKGQQYSVWDMSTNYKTGDIWITQQGGILSVYNQRSGKVIDLAPSIFNASTIRQVDEDTSGNMWFGTQDGRVVKWDLLKSGNDPSKGYELVTVTGMVHKVHYDYQGYVYVATFGRGLLKIDAKTGKVVYVYNSKGAAGKKLFNDFPGDMTYYNDSTLIVTAGCINVINTRTNEVSFFSTEDGLPSNTCQSVQKDKKGILWIGMLNGICRLNLERKVLSYYDRRDGIVQDKFSMAGIKELHDGRLVFYTDHNFLLFDPRIFGQESLPPKPFITGFKVAGHALSLDSILAEDRAVLQYNNTSIGINFSGLSYLQQRKLHYYYMLDGLDKEWIHTDKPIEAIYNYLSPGDYTFRVKSENADGMTSTEIASLQILVRPPVWKTWWFYSLIALLVIGILYLVDRERMKRLRSLQLVRRQIRQNLRDEVAATLNNINVLSEIAKIKADKNIDQAKDFIDQISDKSHHMIEVLDDTLWSIDPANDSMKKIVLRIKELTEGIRINYNIGIDLIVDKKVQEMELDMKLRHELFFFYKEAMYFIVQHIGCDQIFINLNKARKRLMVEILCECDGPADNYRSGFKDAVAARVNVMPATMEVIADSKSFAVVLYVHVK